MTNSDWLYTWIFFWFCFISHLQFASVNGHNYSCSTLCGTNGLCIARRFCRADVNQYLETCEGESRVCCPLQPCCRSVQRPEVTTIAATTKVLLRPDRPREKPPNDGNRPRLPCDDQRPSNDRNSPKLKNRNSTNVGLFNSTCGKKPNDLFNGGGKISEKHEWPWMGSIYMREGSKPLMFLCGGSLINTRYVLSVAHCFTHFKRTNPESHVVLLGSPDRSSGEEFAVSNIVVHHNHSAREYYFNDIALVRLSSDVHVSDKIAPICLPFHDMMGENFVGRMAVVAGWRVRFYGSENSDALKHVTLPVVSNEDCAEAYQEIPRVHLALGSKNLMCAGLWVGSKCEGDAGGPLMFKSQDDRWAVVGLVSLGVGCSFPELPGLYTRVTHYMSWIHENMDPY